MTQPHGGFTSRNQRSPRWAVCVVAALTVVDLHDGRPPRSRPGDGSSDVWKEPAAVAPPLSEAARRSIIRDLDSPEPGARREAFREVWKLGRQALTLLSKKLDHADPATRLDAIEGLGNLYMRSRSDTPLLLDIQTTLADAAGKQDIRERLEITRLLGRMGRNAGGVTRQLLRLLSDELPPYRAFTAWACVRVGVRNAAVLAALAQAVGDRDSPCLYYGLEGYHECIQGTAEDGDEEAQRQAQADLRRLLPALRAISKHPEDVVRVMLVHVLWAMKPTPPQVPELLATLLDDGYAYVGHLAALALVDVAPRALPGKAVDVLCRSMKHQAWSIRHRACLGLARLDKLPAPAIRAVAEALSDLDREVRFEAACLLSRHEHADKDRTARALVEEMEERQELWQANDLIEGIQALIRLNRGSELVRRQLQRCLKSADPRVRELASEAIRCLKGSD